MRTDCRDKSLTHWINLHKYTLPPNEAFRKPSVSFSRVFPLLAHNSPKLRSLKNKSHASRSQCALTWTMLNIRLHNYPGFREQGQCVLGSYWCNIVCQLRAYDMQDACTHKIRITSRKVSQRFLHFVFVCGTCVERIDTLSAIWTRYLQSFSDICKINFIFYIFI